MTALLSAILVTSGLLTALATGGVAKTSLPAVRFVVAVKTNSLQVCSRIVLKMTVRDKSNEEVSVPVQPYDWGVQLVVTDREGKAVPRSKYGQLNLKGPRTVEWMNFYTDMLKPGQDASTRILLNQFFDMTLPGKYDVRVERFVAVGAPTKRPLHLVSNTIHLKLQETDLRDDLP